MKYKLKKETKPTLKTFGKYKAVARHGETITSDRIVKELHQQEGIGEGAITHVLMGLADIVSRHLRQGDCVRLDRWGLMKLELLSDAVDRPSDFHPRDHIRGVRLHFLPESANGKPVLYQDLEFVADKDAVVE